MNAPERIWAFYAPEIAEDNNGATIVAHETVQHGGAPFVRADLFAALEAEKAKAEAECEAFDEALKHEIQERMNAQAARSRAEALLKEAVEALKDACSALDYIRYHYGDLHGVGFDRVRDKHDAILARIKEAKHG